MAAERLGIAVLGAGTIANYHLDGLAKVARADLRMIASRSGDSARRLAEQYRIPQASADWREALDTREIDAVVIATPDHTHEEIAVAAAAAGKHILLQKPMAGSLAACERIARAATVHGVDLQVSFMHRYFDEVQAARALLAEGVIGKLHSLRIRNATPGPDWSDWFFDAANVSAGVVHQLGVHGIDLVSWLVGPIRDVSATVAIQQPTRRLRDGRVVAVQVPDTALAVYRLGEQVMGSHDMSMIEAQGCDRFRLELYGESGTIWLRSERAPLAVWAPQRHGPQWVTPTLAGTPLGQRQHEQWLRGVTGEAARADTAAEAIQGMRVIDAIRHSAERAGARVTVAPGAM
jgi:predicted dehydrogenase